MIGCALHILSVESDQSLEYSTLEMIAYDHVVAMVFAEQAVVVDEVLA